MTKRDTSKHANATTFKKGQSGNPGGRSPRVGPNGETLTQLARAKTLEMFNVLVELTEPQHEPDLRFRAACAVLDRGWGKPKESVDLDANVKGAGLPVIQIVRAAEAPAHED